MGIYIVIGLISSIYLLINVALPHLAISTFVKTYVIQPLLWVVLILVVQGVPGRRPLVKTRFKNSIVQLALGIAFVQVAIYVISGLFFHFGKSPFSLTPLGITTNLIFVSSMLLAVEISRARLVVYWGKRRVFLAITCTALLFSFISIPLDQFTSVKPEILSLSQFAAYWLPRFAENLLASQLALHVGARGSLAYRGLLAAFWWFCPILPDLNWLFMAFIGVSIPIMGMAAVTNISSIMQSGRGRSGWRHNSASFPTGWIVTTIASILVVWFAVGIFPYQPQLVGSGSMSPVINTGDVVIISRVLADEIKVGDVIQFRRMENNQAIAIIHRVVEIQEPVNTRLFITKGDANAAPDANPVNQQNMMGKVVFILPKVGWVSIFARKFFAG